jgi:hypothetical protein
MTNGYDYRRDRSNRDYYDEPHYRSHGVPPEEPYYHSHEKSYYDLSGRVCGHGGYYEETERRRTDEIRAAILDEAWDAKLDSLTESPGGGLDASLLCLPLRRVIAADHPKMIATTAAVAERLIAGGGLLYRYLPQVSSDGLTGREGAFLLCSFWLVDNLA